MNVPLKNPRHEKFVQLLVFGLLSMTEAYKQAGFSERNAGSNALVLSKKQQIAARIASLSSSVTAKAEAKFHISRDRIMEELMYLGFKRNDRQGLVQLKAIELLNKMMGYFEPQHHKHEHTHIQVDASLIEQLRVGYGELALKRVCEPVCEARPLELEQVGAAVGYTQGSGLP